MPMLTTVSIRLPVTPVHSPLRTLVGEGVDLVQHLVHLRHHVDPVDHQAGVPRQPERGVQHGPVLGDVDVLAGEHRVAALGQPDLLAEIDQRGQDLRGDQVLGQVDVQVAGGDR